MNHKSAKKSYQIVLFRPIKALAFQLLSTTKLVHTACMPRAPVGVRRAATWSKPKQYNGLSEQPLMFYRTNCRVFIITVLSVECSVHLCSCPCVYVTVKEVCNRAVTYQDPYPSNW